MSKFYEQALQLKGFFYYQWSKNKIQSLLFWVNKWVWVHWVPFHICGSIDLLLALLRLHSVCMSVRLCMCAPQHYCIFNQQKRTRHHSHHISVSWYLFLSFSLTTFSPGGSGWVERIHLKFAHLTVVRDMDSDSTQLAQSPPLSSLIFGWGI